MQIVGATAARPPQRRLPAAEEAPQLAQHLK
jgi:hypothetical protein